MTSSAHTTLVVCTLLALTTAAAPVVAVAPGSPDATATKSSPSELSAAETPPTVDCSEAEGTSVVAKYETGRKLTDGTTLYPGTTLTLFLCADSEPSEFPAAWGLEDSPAYRILDNGTHWVQITVVESETKSVSLPNRIERRDPSGPSFRVATSSVVQWQDRDNETTAALRFESPADQKAFTRAAADYADAARQFDDSLDAVQTDRESVNLSAEAAPNLTTALDNFERTAGVVQRTSFEASAVGDQRAAAAVVEGSESDVSVAHERARERFIKHLAAVESARAGATRFARFLFGGTLLGGLVVGLVGGAFWSRRTVREVEYDKNFDSNSRLSLTDFTLPLVLGGLTLVVGVAVGGLLGGETLLEVIL